MSSGEGALGTFDNVYHAHHAPLILMLPAGHRNALQRSQILVR